MIPGADPRRTIGVLPGSTFAARRRLLSALEQVFPVRFVAREGDSLSDLDGAVVFDGAHPVGSDQQPPRVPCLVFPPAASDESGGRTAVDLARGESIDRRLRGRRFEDRDVAGRAPLRAFETDDVLATSAGRPVWLSRPRVKPALTLSSVTPPELAEGESIRELLKPGRFMSLLPFVHLLRQVSLPADWSPPPLRAAVIIDDPNLHWTSYGFIRFADLAEHARRHRYHAAMATIPLDLWHVNRRAVQLFRDNADRLSLLVHGNDHLRHELARERSERDARGFLAQVLRRVENFERRTHLAIDRVMVPPHGDCDETMLSALAEAGFDAISWWPKPRSEISHWEIADFAPGGLPSIPRTLLGRWDDLPFRAYLNQPVVLEGHHTDLADGLGLLERAASEVNGLGEVDWCSLGTIAETNVAVRREQSSLHVRMFSRRARVTVPEGVERLVVDAPAYATREGETVLVGGAAAMTPVAARLEEDVPVTAGEIEIRLSRSPANRDAARRPSPWPYGRRLLTEGRDRVLPVTRMASRKRSL